MRCLYTMVYMGNRFLRARVHLPNDTVVLVPSGVAPSLYRSAGICADPFAEWEKRPLDQINKVAFYIYCGSIARLSVYRLFPPLCVSAGYITPEVMRRQFIAVRQKSRKRVVRAQRQITIPGAFFFISLFFRSSLIFLSIFSPYFWMGNSSTRPPPPFQPSRTSESERVPSFCKGRVHNNNLNEKSAAHQKTPDESWALLGFLKGLKLVHSKTEEQRKGNQ